MKLQENFGSFRDQFYMPKCSLSKKELVYLCGHSLGLQPKSARLEVENELKVWQNLAVEGHVKESQWFSYHEKLSASLARIVGASESEVIAMNSLTVNIHLMLASFYDPTKNRYKIITDAPCFPSDKYCLDSMIRFRGFDPASALIKVETIQDGSIINTEQLIDVIEKNKDETCLVFLNAINYFSGQYFDIPEISKYCTNNDITFGLDLAHAIGNVPLKLNDWAVDFATWCSYKYLNGSPGAVGGCFINEKHFGKKLNRLEGWWGSESAERFITKEEFSPMPTAEAWQLSNPAILVMAALKASLNIFDKVNINALWEIGSGFTSLCEDLLTKSKIRRKIKIINNIKRFRGNMLSMIPFEKNVKDLEKQLRTYGVVVDSRLPNVIRASFCPLYNNQNDVQEFVRVLENAL